MATSIPHFRKSAHSRQLVVHGEPFLILGGEVQNSQFSSGKYMDNVWSKLKGAHLNTIFGSVSWEQVEPIEGKFDFDELDKVVLGARKHGLHLVLLWFGSFKNGLSTYTPSWVKCNAKRFPRAELRSSDGKRIIGDVLSIFGTEAQYADALAFTALMQHIKSIDEHHSTVIMVQVENEVGLLGDSRDRSVLAEVAWNRPIPSHLVTWIAEDWTNMNPQFRSNFAEFQALACSSNEPLTWSAIPAPAPAIDELFMAYHYSLYVEAVALAGKTVYPLPLFTNVWQNYAGEDRDGDLPPTIEAAGGGSPGDYPSGGGVTNVLDVWKAFAPSLDLIAPDIYLNDYARSCAAYRHRDQPLLIPEQRRDDYGARRTWVAVGTYAALGVAPFGIDTLDLEENVFRKHYGLMEKVQRHILEAQIRVGASLGFFFDELKPDGSDPSPSKVVRFGEWQLTIERAFVFGKPGPGCGLIIHMGGSKFLLVGWGFQVLFKSIHPTAHFTGLLRFEEKEVEDGQLRTLRLLNGDETKSGKCAIMPNEAPDYGGFPISITIPANTGIAICEPYALFEDDLERRN